MRLSASREYILFPTLAVTQSVILPPPAFRSPEGEGVVKTRFQGPLSQTLWGWGPSICTFSGHTPPHPAPHRLILYRLEFDSHCPGDLDRSLGKSEKAVHSWGCVSRVLAGLPRTGSPGLPDRWTFWEAAADQFAQVLPFLPQGTLGLEVGAFGPIHLVW